MSLLGDDHRLLDALTPDDRRALLDLGRRRSYSRGECFVHEGDKSRFVSIVAVGWVAIATTTSGGSNLILAIRGPGDVVGDLSALDGRPRSASVVALDTVQLVTLSDQRFREFLAERPPAALAYMRNLATRLRDADAERRALVSASVLQRLACLLIELTNGQGTPNAEGVSIRPALPQRELAALVGATREAIAKALRLLRSRDIVRTGPRQIIVVHRDLLELLANGEMLL